MAMTVTEANAFNQLMDWLFKSKTLDGRKISDADAKEAAKILARSSNKRLMAGITPDQVDGRWRHRRK
jgi:hypothetical protein